MATGVKEGQQYVVDGAIFRCQYGSAPCQIMAISNQKVTAQNKPIVTDKDVTFKIPTAPFVTCSQSKQVPPTCVYANGIWKTQTTVKHGDQNAIVEKSEMNCPVCQGKIECIFPGQVQSVSAPELAEFKIETLSVFPLAMEVSYNTPPKEDTPQKTSGVNAVSVSPQTFRAGEEIIIHAFKKSNKTEELTAPKHVNVVVFSTKEVEETKGTGKKAKTEKVKYIDKLMTFKEVCSPFKIKLNDPGKYSIEAGSDGILAGDSNVKGYNNIDIQKPLIKGKNIIPPMYNSCTVDVNVISGNSITDIKKAGDKKAISDTVYVKQGEKTTFTPVLTLDYNSDFELLKCSVTKQKGEAVIADDYKFDEGGHSLTLTPSSAEVDYKITFSLYKKTDETIEETPVSEKSILVHSYNEAVLYAYVPGATKGSANGNTTLRRPGDTLIFTVKQKDGKAENLDKIVWNVKKDGKLFEKDIKGEMILYKFKEEGVYTIEADLKGTSLSNGGVKGDILTDFDEESANPENKNVVVLDEVDKRLVNEEGKESSAKSVNGENPKERVITHKLKISRNEVTEVRLGATNGKRYVGVRYTIDPSFLFGDATYRDERNNVVYTCEGADADCLKRGIFLATKPGDYIVKAILNGKECKSLPFTIQDATFSKWEFCDSEKKKISHIGRNMKFGINASVPAWAQTSSDEKKQNKEITVSIFCKGRAIQSFKTKLDEAGSFHIDNIDVEKDIIANAKNIVSFDGIQDLIITFVVNDSPSKIVKGLSISKVGHGLFSTKANLTVKTKPFIDGYFADKSGKKLVKIVNYVDGSSNNKVTARLNVLNYSKENLKNLKFCLYENKWGIDPIVFKSEDFNSNESGIVEISIPLNEGNIKEKDHGDSKLPRLFYFKVFERKISYSLTDGRPTSTWQKVCAYPKSPGDLYNYNVQAEMSAVQNEALKELSENVAGKDYNSDKLNTVRSYYYQLKISKQSEESKKYVNSYNNLAPVVVGEDWEKEEKEEEKGCKCPRCNEEADKMLVRVKNAGIFSSKAEDKLKIICETYCKYMRQLHMDTCWIKAHFFAQIFVESGKDIEAHAEDLSRYERDTPGNKNTLENIFASRIFEGNYVGEGENRHWESVHNYSKDMKDKVSNDNRVYRTDNDAQNRIDKIYSTTKFGTTQRDVAIANFVYDGVNGNKKGTQDGSIYKGGGYIQITGRQNYQNIASTINAIVAEEDRKNFDLMKGAKELNGNVALSTLASMVYLYRRNIYMRLYVDEKMSYVANGQENTYFVNKLVGKKCSKKIIDEKTKKETDSTNYKEKQKAFDKLAKAFEVDNCDWGEEFTDSTEDKNIYRIDLDKFSFFQYQKNNNSNKYVYKMYNKGEKIREFEFTAQNLQHRNGLLAIPFPETSEDAEKNAIFNNPNFKNLPKWGRYSPADGNKRPESDNWANPVTCAALLGFFYSLPLNDYSGYLYYNDITVNGNPDGHRGHKNGDDIDIRYPGSKNGGIKETWDKVVKDYFEGDESRFIKVLENILTVANKWKFSKNWVHKGKIVKGSNNGNPHHDHFHLGNEMYLQIPK
ncbi:MAG: PAAR-like protein [Paludibacteraceae bacterium]|nr:PAAR-like protein [Paludibacteraceae bacterium]